MDLVFIVDRGGKIKISDIYFAGNENVDASKLKQQMKGTKEKGHFTLYPSIDTTRCANYPRPSV
jgi:outer membrane protein insertion porin family